MVSCCCCCGCCCCVVVVLAEEAPQVTRAESRCRRCDGTRMNQRRKSTMSRNRCRSWPEEDRHSLSSRTGRSRGGWGERWTMAGETRWQTANQEGVAAIGTPGGSSMKTCGGEGELREQVDEEMTLRPPCSTGEACDSHSRWRLTDRDLTIVRGLEQRVERPSPGLISGAQGATKATQG
jgi:hypothetical protein